MILKNRQGETLFETEAATMKELVEKAVGARANIYGADIRGADLRGANLRRVKLDGADLRWADLTGAKK